MKEDNNGITGLFRNRLGHAEMEVREGFWEELQQELSSKSGMLPVSTHTFFTPKFYRVVAAASVVLVLGMASAAFWYFSPKEEIKEAFTQVEALTHEGNLHADMLRKSFPSIHPTAPTAQAGNHSPAPVQPAGLAGQTVEETDETMSVQVSITITQRVYGKQTQGNSYYGNRHGNDGYQRVSGYAENQNEQSVVPMENEEQKTVSAMKKTNSSPVWSFKVMAGTSLPSDNFLMPLTAGVSLERKFNSRLSLEAGLQYNYLSAKEGMADHLHALAVPVKMNVMLAATSKTDWYATVGGTVEKTINKTTAEDPFRLSAFAGLGVAYKVNERFSVFAEPTVSHHFDTDSRVRSLRSERPTNLNLLCGVRMTY